MHLDRRQLVRALAAAGLGSTTLTSPFLRSARAAAPIRLGVVYDLTGPLAAAGGVAEYVGTQIAFDIFNQRGGAGGQLVEMVAADSQSKVDAALNEAERLISQEKLDVVMGVYSSAAALPLAARFEQAKRVLWICGGIASGVLKGRNLTHVFRPNYDTDQSGETAVQFAVQVARDRLKIEPAKLRLAMLSEDGPYGSGIALANEAAAARLGAPVVLKETYAAATPDMSTLVTKLRRERPDVILHAGYINDVTLFLKQAKLGGLRAKALIGQGAGYGQLDRLYEAVGKDVDHVFNADSASAQLFDAAKLRPEVAALSQEFVKRYIAKTGEKEPSPQAAMGFNNAWIFLEHVLKPAVQKYGGAGVDAVRRAALEADVPVGGTVQGYGVKLAPPGHASAGQNLRAFPVVMQYADRRAQLVWPDAVKTQPAVFPLPASSPYAERA